MNYKKLSIALLSGIMAVSMAGCGGGGDAADDEPKIGTDQTEFEVMSAIGALSSPYDQKEILKELQDQAGIKINWTTKSDDLSEQVNIRIAGDDLPDAFQGVGFSNYDLTNYGEDGTFIDLTPYSTEEYMPNLTKILADHPDIRKAITMDDGKIYGLPSAEKMGTAAIGADQDYSIFTIPQFSMINKRWLDELGLEMPETLDELHDVLKAFKDNNMAQKDYGADTTIPMSFGMDQWSAMIWKSRRTARSTSFLMMTITVQPSHTSMTGLRKA